MSVVATVPKPVMSDFWRQPYRAPSFPNAGVLVLVILFALFTFVRGWDYAFSDDPAAMGDTVMRALASKAVWGTALMCGAGALLISLVLRLRFLVWISHVYLAALYMCIFIMITQAVAWSGWDGGTHLMIAPAGSFVWHGIFAWLIRPTRRVPE